MTLPYRKNLLSEARQEFFLFFHNFRAGSVELYTFDAA